MSLQPLLTASPWIQAHAVAALLAFVLGPVQFLLPKGTLPHRALGWSWVLLMIAVAGSSFWIHEIRLWGRWSPIHLLSVFTIFSLAGAVVAARRHRPDLHRYWMIGIYVGALLITGALTLLPGRMMHAVVFGT